MPISRRPILATNTLPTESAPATPESVPAKLLTPAEVGDLLVVGRKVLERWRSAGRGPAFARLTSKTIRYPAADVARFLAAQTVTPVASSDAG